MREKTGQRRGRKGQGRLSESIGKNDNIRAWKGWGLVTLQYEPALKPRQQTLGAGQGLEAISGPAFIVSSDSTLSTYQPWQESHFLENYLNVLH